MQSPQWQLRADRKAANTLKVLGKAHLMDHATGKGLIGAVPVVVASGLGCCIAGLFYSASRHEW